MQTCVTPRPASQAASASKPPAMVENCERCLTGLLPSPSNAQATMVA